jgi:hypothetical protein
MHTSTTYVSCLICRHYAAAGCGAAVTAVAAVASPVLVRPPQAAQSLLYRNICSERTVHQLDHDLHFLFNVLPMAARALRTVRKRLICDPTSAKHIDMAAVNLSEHDSAVTAGLLAHNAEHSG